MINSIQHAREKAVVEGVVTALSPKIGKFFDGMLNDDSGRIHFVAFNEAQ